MRFTRRAKPREIKEGDAKFGKRVTADTIVLRNLKDRGIGGETNAIVFYDLYSGPELPRRRYGPSTNSKGQMTYWGNCTRIKQESSARHVE